MPKLGDLPGAVQVLREVQQQLVREGTDRQMRPSAQRQPDVTPENDRWISLRRTAKKIDEACDSQDLESLVSHVREMKNRLRRPSIRKDLACMEAKDKSEKEKKKNPEGECVCSRCGKTIEGSTEPCIEGALCTTCGLAKEKSDDQRQVAKDAKAGQTSSQADKSADSGSGKNIESESVRSDDRGLRRRSYVRV